MRCVKCGHDLKVENTYEAGGQARTLRSVCTNSRCRAVHTLVTEIKAVEPGYGEGAAALAKRMKNARE